MATLFVNYNEILKEKFHVRIIFDFIGHYNVDLSKVVKVIDENLNKEIKDLSK